MALIHPDERPPSLLRRSGEVAQLWPRLLRSFGHLQPRGPLDGDPVLVIPGFLATDRTTMELRRALAEAGYRVYPWKLGLNRGAHKDIVRHLRQRLEEVHDGRPVLLVGWSLGGVFARELAREVPSRVRAVVTLGSPFSGTPYMTNVWKLYERIAGHKVDAPPIPHHPHKPPVPALALWSRQDGIVAPRAARGLPDESDAAVELRCSHMAFGVGARATREAVRAIDRFLAEQEGAAASSKRSVGAGKERS
ncbi:alpha/beta fold hydrolase [Sphingomonas ginkgonis]|uniref:Alpha/beta fold hydrolase n=1 Tax=Sphingomonas ginkgonis TaxID=2315330 RepID=A0A429V6C1_9SPHN|nr:alpha/beta fold hydrolase [Sphingomonas ginkgonis]RST29474.1 alpha/beta fold hydrolase [Sphingomonas ginkgonis]